jgi:thymidylate synthase (FAD)
MKLIKPYFEIIEQEPGLEGIYKQIELAGRTCYKSEDKITPDSAKGFVDRMIKSGHGAMLEHGTVYLKNKSTCFYELSKYQDNKYSVYRKEYIEKKVCQDDVDYYYSEYVTTNLRVLVENGWMDDLKYICEPTEYHEKRVTVKFICDRVTGESFLRHRAIDEDHPTIEGEVTREMEKDIDSFARESTRYCNYTKDKFDNQFTIITPPEFYEGPSYDSLSYFGDTDDKIFRNMCCSISAGEIEEDFGIFETWMFANLATQWAYNRLISLGWQAQQARRVIPLDIKSPLVMTAFISDWKHFFELRCDKAAHPQARELAIPLQEEFIKRQYV